MARRDALEARDAGVDGFDDFAHDVEAIPARPLSRNSSMLLWAPTATMSSAPSWYARSIATSSLVPGAEKTL